MLEQDELLGEGTMTAILGTHASACVGVWACVRGRMCVWACVGVCLGACLGACVCVRVCACGCG